MSYELRFMNINPKFQIPNKSQSPISNDQNIDLRFLKTSGGGFEFGYCKLFGIWCL
jgi:hypothetical protein